MRGRSERQVCPTILRPIFSTSGHVSSTSCHINKVPSKLVPEQSLHFLHLPSLPFPFFIIFMSKFSLFRERHFKFLYYQPRKTFQQNEIHKLSFFQTPIPSRKKKKNLLVPNFICCFIFQSLPLRGGILSERSTHRQVSGNIS